MDLATARNRAREILGDVAGGLDPADERRADRQAGTFGELATEYIEKHAKQQKRSWGRIIASSMGPNRGSEQASVRTCRS
jgi:hypothetical protein